MLKCKHEFDIFLSVTILSSIVFASIYSLLTTMRLLSFHAGIFDLGVNSSLLYNVVKTGIPEHTFLTHGVAMNKLIYIPLSALYAIYPHQITILTIQDFWISGGTPVLYCITKIVTKDRITSLFISLSYLIYYPMAGVYWFDFHFMAFFPTLFFLTFYFYLKGSKKISFFFGFLAMITDLLSPLIMLFFSIYVIVVGRRNNYTHYIKNTYVLGLMFSSGFILLLSTLYFGINYPTSYLNVGQQSFLAPIPNPIADKGGYIFGMTAPTLLFSFASPETMMMTVPYFLFALKNNYFPYISTMFYQYPSLATPPIFVSTVYGLKRITERISKVRIKKNMLKLSAIILILNVILALFLTPLGNFATDSGPYNTRENISANQTTIEMYKIIDMVPKNSSILLQDNMPQFTEGYNWTLPDFLKPDQIPSYIFTDPYSPSFDTYSLYQPGNYTMQSAVAHLEKIAHYGIYAKYGDIELLKLNYHGKPQIPN